MSSLLWLEEPARLQPLSTFFHSLLEDSSTLPLSPLFQVQWGSKLIQFVVIKVCPVLKCLICKPWSEYWTGIREFSHHLTCGTKNVQLLDHFSISRTQTEHLNTGGGRRSQQNFKLEGHYLSRIDCLKFHGRLFALKLEVIQGSMVVWYLLQDLLVPE